MADTPVKLPELEAIFQNSPQEAHSRLRAYHDERRSDFLREAIALLESGRNNSFSQVVWKICQENTADLQQLLFTVDLLNLDDAAKLLRLSGSKDPGYQISLVERVRKEIETGGQNLSQQEWTRLLELLAKSVDGERLGGMLARLCEHRDKRLRSKAAVLMGLVARSVPGRLNLLRDVDPRVRANAVEALWGCRDPESIQLLREASRDEHHRVAANGLVGLHAAGELSAVLGIMQMYRDPELPRKLASIWAMGKTADPRFLSFIQANLNQLNGRARFSLLATSRKIQTRIHETRQRGQLAAELLHFERADRGRVRMQFRLRAANGSLITQEHLLPTEVLVQDGPHRVDLFTLQHRGSPSPKQVGLLLPQRPGVSDLAAQQLVTALEENLAARPSADSWAIARFHAGGEPEADVVFTRDSSLLASSQLRNPKAAGALPEAIFRLVQAFPPGEASRELILFLDAQSGADAPTAASWLGPLEANGVGLHIILTEPLPEEILNAWRSFAARRRGLVRLASNGKTIGAQLAATLDSFNPHWYLTYMLGRLLPPEEAALETRIEFYTGHGYGQIACSQA